jgi:peptidoglycan/LPS O-acetylase OafA/YrhL
MISSIAKNYEYRIDIMRAIACGLVALVHVSVPTWTAPLRVEANYFEGFVLSVIECGWLGVPIFLFVSGYSLALGKFNADSRLDITQFFINRILRIYPAYFVVLCILLINHKIDGNTAVLLALFQLQNLPPSTAFNITWSLQLEVACYLLFPVFLMMLKNSWKNIFWAFGLFLTLRLYQGYLPASNLFQISYSNLLGGANLFILGMFAAKLPRLVPCLATKVTGFIGLLTIGLFCVFVASYGNYQAPQGKAIKYVFLFLPELIGLALVLISVGYTRVEHSTKPSILVRPIVYFGKISYSAFLFSLFTHDLIYRLYFPEPGSWTVYLSFLFVYFCLLTILATFSFYGVEKPFLDMRKNYLRTQ